MAEGRALPFDGPRLVLLEETRTVYSSSPCAAALLHLPIVRHVGVAMPIESQHFRGLAFRSCVALRFHFAPKDVRMHLYIILSEFDCFVRWRLWYGNFADSAFSFSRFGNQPSLQKLCC